MAGQGFGRGNGGHIVTKDFFDGFQFADIAYRGTGTVSIDIIHRFCHFLQGLLHAAYRPFAGGLHHIEAVGSGAVADQFGVNGRAASFGVLQLFEHQHSATAGDHKPVAIDIIGA